MPTGEVFCESDQHAATSVGCHCVGRYESHTLCFSVASMNTEKTKAAVSSSSMTKPKFSKIHFLSDLLQHSHKPRTTDVPPPNIVSAFTSPGNNPLTNPAAAIPPANCAPTTVTPFFHPKLPSTTIPNVIAGLNSPLEIRKKIHAFTIIEKPTLSAA